MYIMEFTQLYVYCREHLMYYIPEVLAREAMELRSQELELESGGALFVPVCTHDPALSMPLPLLSLIGYSPYIVPQRTRSTEAYKNSAETPMLSNPRGRCTYFGPRDKVIMKAS